jgi:hypothetical protein
MCNFKAKHNAAWVALTTKALRPICWWRKEQQVRSAHFGVCTHELCKEPPELQLNASLYEVSRPSIFSSWRFFPRVERSPSHYGAHSSGPRWSCHRRSTNNS